MRNVISLTRVIIVLLFVASLFLTSAPNIEAGFGVSPPRITEDKLVKGSVIERTIYLVQGNPLVPASIEVTIDDSPYSSWVSFDPGTTFEIPAGIQQFPLKVKIEIPNDTQLGIYKMFIRVKSVPKEASPESGGSGVSIALAGRIDVELTVGEGAYYAFRILDLDLANITQVQSPKVSLTVENMGNVLAGPKSATFELFNKFGDVRLAYVQGVNIAPVNPFKTETISAEFPIPVRLGVGEYWGTVRLYDDDTLVREFKDVFNVEESTFWEKYSRYVIFGGAGFVLLCLLLIFVRRVGRR